MLHVPKNIVNLVKENYPQGTRIKLITLNKPYTKIPSGTEGIVNTVDDNGTIFATFDTGHTVGLVYGEDYYKKA